MGLGELSPLHIVLVLAIAMLVIGPGKLPEVGSAVGRSLREFRRAASGDDELQPAAAVTAAPAPAIEAPVVQAAPATTMAPAVTAEAPVPASTVASTPTDPIEHPAGA